MAWLKAHRQRRKFQTLFFSSVKNAASKRQTATEKKTKCIKFNYVSHNSFNHIIYRILAWIKNEMETTNMMRIQDTEENKTKRSFKNSGHDNEE